MPNWDEILAQHNAIQQGYSGGDVIQPDPLSAYLTSGQTIPSNVWNQLSGMEQWLYVPDEMPSGWHRNKNQLVPTANGTPGYLSAAWRMIPDDYIAPGDSGADFIETYGPAIAATLATYGMGGFGSIGAETAASDALATTAAESGTAWGPVDYSLGASQLMPAATSTAVPALGTGTSAMGLNALGGGATSLASTIPGLAAATTPSLASVGLTGYTPTISDAVVNAATTPATSGGLLDMVNSIPNRDLLRTGMSLLGGNQPPQMMGGQSPVGGGGVRAGGIPELGLLSVQRNPYVDIFGASGRRN